MSWNHYFASYLDPSKPQHDRNKVYEWRRHGAAETWQGKSADFDLLFNVGGLFYRDIATPAPE
jgi:hypothetical protein